jgi:hypothetical protein
VDRMLPDPTTAALSNREIARRCGCSEGYVRGRRKARASAHGTQMDTPSWSAEEGPPTPCGAEASQACYQPRARQGRPLNSNTRLRRR